MERRRTLGRSTALRLAGLVGIGTALYHGIEGALIVDAIDMSAHDKQFVSATYQLGTMGWLAIAVMLIGAAGFDSLKARSWVVWTAVALYGMPAFGTLVLTGGEPNVGGICLGLSVALALYGRSPDRSDAGG